jgi:hypothetical protein
MTSRQARCNFAAEFIFQETQWRPQKKRQCIVDLIASSAAGVSRIELAAAGDSSAGCVSVMIFRINKELVSQGWKISSTELDGQPGRRGAPGRHYRLVRFEPEHVNSR